MQLRRLYGQKAIHIQDGKLTYRSRNGYIDVPEHMVRRLMMQGFTLHPQADAPPPGDTIVDEHPVEPLATPPATSTAPLPDGHPQVGATKAESARQDLRDEARLRLERAKAANEGKTEPSTT